MHIPFPTNTRQQIEDIINDIGRAVLFVTSTLSGCYNCSLDPVTNTSVDSFCPVCSGIYWIPTYSSNSIVAHVAWKYADDAEFNTGGNTYVGDGKVKIIYSGPYMDILEDTDYLVVDGKQASIEKITLLGVPHVNRISIDFKEKSKEDDTE